MNSKGFSLLELLVVLGVLGIALSIAALNLRPFSNPLEDAWVQTEGYLKLVRAKAMATTSAYRVEQSGNRLVAEYAARCGSPSFTPDPSLVLELPQGVNLSTGNGSPLELCFSSRGYSDRNLVLVFRKGAQERQLEVLLGGEVRRL
ncbi:prepilin-type N-terminal cleavage/methylation domain-containing protein [Thermus sp.]|uniref:prepilin-type N-terminal cleavage/methylation domain-containing protein n=1 Tax=Thermus sp. TaxID=275 RepID=UPI00307F60B9